MSQHSAIDTTVAALGYELVEVERAPGGLLRVTIDHPAVEGGPERFINVDDCERVTRQLQHVLEVEGVCRTSASRSRRPGSTGRSRAPPISGAFAASRSR